MRWATFMVGGEIDDVGAPFRKLILGALFVSRCRPVGVLQRTELFARCSGYNVFFVVACRHGVPKHALRHKIADVTLPHPSRSGPCVRVCLMLRGLHCLALVP